MQRFDSWRRQSSCRGLDSKFLSSVSPFNALNTSLTILIFSKKIPHNANTYIILLHKLYIYVDIDRQKGKFLSEQANWAVAWNCQTRHKLRKSASTYWDGMHTEPRDDGSPSTLAPVSFLYLVLLHFHKKWTKCTRTFWGQTTSPSSPRGIALYPRRPPVYQPWRGDSRPGGHRGVRCG